MSKSFMVLFLAACTLAAANLRTDAAATLPEQDRNRVEAERQYREHLEAFTNNSEVLVLPGLMARRDAREVRVLAESSAISAGDPLEFGLVSTASGHGYEALAVALAKPSSVYAALRFIGLMPGHSPDPAQLAFWPKGERTAITVLARGTNAWTGEIALESLLWNVPEAQARTPAGFVFVDAPRVRDPNAPDVPRFLPDESEVGSIVSLYNEPATVFDVPRMAAQGSVYGSQKANPRYLLPAQTLLEFVFRPERAAAGPRVQELILTVKPAAVGLPTGIGPRFTLTGAALPFQVPPDLTTTDLVSIVDKLVQSGRDPFVRVRFDDALSLGEVHSVCGFLAEHEGEFGLRIEPPDPGQLYYRAFIPDEHNRRREDRVRQPWELRLQRGASNTLATVTHLEERWHDDQPDPEIVATDRVLAEPSELRAAFDALGPGMPVMLIFAEPTLSHGELMRWVQIARPTHGIVHVYLSEK